MLNPLEVEQELKRRLHPETKKLLLDGLFDKQLRFNYDPSRFKAALNTRRSGKSFLAATRLLRSCTHAPSSINPYIALTRDSAKRNLWPILVELNERFSLGGNPIESALTMEFPNLSQVFLVGADQKNYINRLRGIKARLAVIDEVQSYRDHVEELINAVLSPALLDFNGELDLYGTPGLRPSGFFYDVTNEQRGFSVHRWSVLDNPFVPNPAGFIQEMKTRNGWTDDNPTYRREWLGEWVLDEDSLLFKFDPKRNVCSEINDKPLYRVIGMDLGFEDATAFSVCTYSDHSPKIFCEYTYQKSGMIPSEIAKCLQGLIDRFNPVKIVADTGGLGKSIVEEMRRRYSMNIHAAEKTEKLTAINLLNGDLIDANFQVMAGCKDLMAEWTTLAKGEDGLEDPNMPCDLSDATLYAYRDCKHYAFSAKKPKISRDSEQYLDQLVEKESNRHHNQEEWWEKIDDN